jgi:hypothetical protein
MESNRSRQWQAWFDSICGEYEVGPKKTGRFEPNPEDAFKLAALQWWTHTLGRTLIEVYATDRRQYDRMSKILSDAHTALRLLAGPQALTIAGGDACSTDQDCPKGFFCDEGTCEPLLATE